MKRCSIFETFRAMGVSKEHQVLDQVLDQVLVLTAEK